MEVKLSANPTHQDMERLNRAADLVKATRRFLVSQTRTITEGEKQASCDLPWMLENIETQFA